MKQQKNSPFLLTDSYWNIISIKLANVYFNFKSDCFKRTFSLLKSFTLSFWHTIYNHLYQQLQIGSRFGYNSDKLIVWVQADIIMRLIGLVVAQYLMSRRTPYRPKQYWIQMRALALENR